MTSNNSDNYAKILMDSVLNFVLLYYMIVKMPITMDAKMQGGQHEALT